MIYLAYTSVSCVIMKKVKAGTYGLNNLLFHVPLFPTKEPISQLIYAVGTMKERTITCLFLASFLILPRLSAKGTVSLIVG